MRISLPLLLFLIWALPVTAGPWPRTPGTGFLSFSYGQDPANARPSREFYGEYGLTGAITLAMAWRRQTYQRAEISARWHPDWQPLGLRFGFGAGIQISDVPRLRNRLLLESHLGRGFDLDLGNLWFRLGLRSTLAVLSDEAAAEYDRPAHWIETDLGAQIGLRRGDWLGIGSLSRFATPNGRQIKLTLGLGYRLSERFTLIGEVMRGQTRYRDWAEQPPPNRRFNLTLWMEL